jgi:hypothetical protein
MTRYTRLLFRWLLAGQAILLHSCLAVQDTPIATADDSVRIELRPRKDAGVTSDIQAALDLQRRYLESKPPVGLSEWMGASDVRPLAEGTTSTSSVNLTPPIVGQTSGEVRAAATELSPCDGSSLGLAVATAPSVASATTAVPTITRVAPAQPLPPNASRARPTPPAAVVADREAQRKPSLPVLQATGQPSITLLPPPKLTPIAGWEAAPMARPAADHEVASHRWRPVSTKVSGNDPEATVPPQLSSGAIQPAGPATGADPITPGISIQPAADDSGSVVSAAYQQAASGSLSAPPAMSMPMTPVPSSPSPSASNILPGPPSSTVLPGPMGAVPPSLSGSYPGAPAVPSPGLPSYPPAPSSTFVNGEPFVTSPPPQFDAHFMVQPTNCYMPVCQNPATGCCQNPAAWGGGSAGTYAGPYPYPYTGLPGTIAPPTYMPDQLPGLYPVGGAGCKPLISCLGQEKYNVQLGRGIVGQPVAYVPGQHFRNFLRYISP